MKNKKFPLDFEIDDETLFLHLTDSTMVIDLPTYFRASRESKLKKIKKK